MKRGLPGGNFGFSPEPPHTRRPHSILHVGLDLSRRRLDVHVLDEPGETVSVTTAPPDRDGLAHLVREIDLLGGGRVLAAIESMNGDRSVHDALELLDWEVEIADAYKVKGLAPVACKTDRIDAWVLAELSRRELVPAIWLLDPDVRAERERARYRIHLVRHRTMFKNRVHAAAVAFGKPCPVSDLFSVGGRELLERLGLHESWNANLEAALGQIDHLGEEIHACELSSGPWGQPTPTCRCSPVRRGSAGCWATPSPRRSATSAASRARRSWSATPACAHGCTSPAAAITAAHWPRTGPSTCAGRSSKQRCTAGPSSVYREHYERTANRLGRQRGNKVARVEVARKLAEAIWHMLTKSEPFAPARSRPALAGRARYNLARKSNGRDVRP
jgi:transposase